MTKHRVAKIEKGVRKRLVERGYEKVLNVVDSQKSRTERTKINYLVTTEIEKTYMVDRS